MLKLSNGAAADDKLSFKNRLKSDIRRNYPLYILILPVLAYYLIFCYKPMYGALIAFKEYRPDLGVFGSPWVGFYQFKRFFANPDFVRILRNTLTISISSIVFGFPAPIILALLFNELKMPKFKSVAQTISYLPHFISLVVVCGLVKTFVSQGGIIYQLVTLIGDKKVGLLSRPECFVPIYVLSDIWQQIGWSSIIYIAALSAIDQELYEAARIDGANKWKRVIHVTLPGIAPTIIIMFILRMGSLLSVGYEKIILLYNPLIYETSDVILSYNYRVGLEQQDWSYSSAVGLLNSAINFLMIIVMNKLSATFSDTSLW
ncbi:MAG: sugar ABC transporter permease [Clostridia bacterium]|nr:sugar ABC transporter permease [Clostridia bacterium]